MGDTRRWENNLCLVEMKWSNWSRACAARYIYSFQAVSVTRFGEFSPLWVTIIVLWPFRKCTFSIWQSGITACHQILMSALLAGHCCHLLTCKTLPIVTITINFCACKWRIFTTKLHFCSVNTSFNESRGRPVLVDLSGRSQGRFPCVSNVYQKIILLRTRQRLA